MVDSVQLDWRELSGDVINAEDFLQEMLYLALFVPPGAAPFPPELVQQPEFARYIKGWGRTGDYALVAQVAGEPVGAIWCRLFKATDPGFGFVAEDVPELAMSVKPDYRGQGVGRQLLRQFLLRSYFKRKVLRISLSVSDNNFAKTMYETAGFQTIRKDGDSTVMLWAAESAMN